MQVLKINYENVLLPTIEEEEELWLSYFQLFDYTVTYDPGNYRP